MGLSLFPLIAEIFMDYLEKIIINKTKLAMSILK